MKRKLNLILIIGVLYISQGFSQAVKSNYNLDFENSLSSLENSWITLLDGFEWRMDSIDKINGKYSSKFQRTYLGRGFEMCLFQKIVLPNPGKKISVSLYSKCDQLESAWIKVTAFNKSILPFVYDSICLIRNEQRQYFNKSKLREKGLYVLEPYDYIPNIPWQKFDLSISADKQIYAISLDIGAIEPFKVGKKSVVFGLDYVTIQVDGKDIADLNQKNFTLKRQIKSQKKTYNLNDNLEITPDETQRISNKNIIGFGETVHGSLELQEAIINNLKQLVTKSDCRLILLEISIEAGLLVNQFINDDIIGRQELDTILSNYAYDKNLFFDFLSWLKDFNSSTENKVIIFGIDDYVNRYSSPLIITKFLKNKNLNAPLMDSLLLAINKHTRKTIVLNYIEQNSIRLASLLGEKDFFMFLQAMKVRTDSLYRLSPKSTDWTLAYRDNLMWENTRFAIENLTNQNSTVALYLHLSHLLKNHPVLFDDVKSLGQYINTYFPNKYYLMGFSVGFGKISTWDFGSKNRIYSQIGSPPKNSIEYYCSHFNRNIYIKNVSDLPSELFLIRKIGIELHPYSQFEPLNLKENMDSFVFIYNSTPLRISSVPFKENYLLKPKENY